MGDLMLKTGFLRLGHDQTETDPGNTIKQSVPFGLDESDAGVIARARRDPAAFAPLYTRYSGPVFGYCLRRLGNREMAEDATSLVFVRVLGSLSRCRSEQFRPWLFGIAHNVTTDVLRTRGRSVALPDEDERHDPGQLPVDVVLEREGEGRVHALLADLNPVQRQIVELRLAGLTGAEIVTVLGWSHGAIRIAQLRAYRRLREVIAASG